MTEGTRRVCFYGFKKPSVFLSILLVVSPAVLTGLPLLSQANVKTKMPDYYAEPGLNRFRDLVAVHPHEVIDPFTGGLQLRHLDFNAPGPGGFSLKIYRVYNSNNVYLTRDASLTAGGTPTILQPRTPTGLGWTIHFGRIFRSGADANPCASTTGDTLDNPVLETPDGSQQILFNNNTGIGALYISRDQWLGHCLAGNAGLLVISPDGTRYTMNYRVGGTLGNETNFAWYTTRIEDRNGYAVNITYNGTAGSTSMDALVGSVTGSVSANFYYSGSGSNILLSSISAGGISRSYYYTAVTSYSSPNYYYLTSVTSPAGNGMQYYYHALTNGVAGNRLLSRAVFQYGATANYTYGYVCLNATEASGYVCDGAPTYYSTVVRSKTTGGPGITSGTWNYSYAQTATTNQTMVTFPGGSYVYTHVGARVQSSNSASKLWQIGLLLEKATYSGGTLVDRETYTWSSGFVSNERYVRPPYDGSPGAPLYYDTTVVIPVLLSKTLVRNGATYTTSYGSFTTDGSFRPLLITENGQAARTVNLTYPARNPQTNLLQLIGNETVSSALGSSLTQRDYDSRGNLLRLVKDGVAETYTYSGGDLASRTNARGKLWTYTSHVAGIPRSELHPEGVSITRTVNSSTGTIASETNGRGYTTSYTYDGLNRITSITPPAGSPVSVVWGANSRTVTRGTYQQVTTLDGFARPTQINTNGITQTFNYDALGFKSFESYYSTTTGDTIANDVLGRVTRVTHADGTFRTHGYAGNQLKITNERNQLTTYNYRSFGDPNKKDLVQVTAPETVTTAFTRNLLGLPTAVTQGGITRSYGYDTHYFLVSETHPETGTTTYTRDEVGNLLTRQVGSSGITRHTYDGLNRLTFTDYPGTTPDVTTQYDATGNVTVQDNGTSRRVLTYDANNNARTEALTVGTLTLNAAYGYNTLDQLSTITYPSLRQVSYAPDAVGRPTQAMPYLTSVVHHPNGVPQTLTFANGHTTTNTLTNRQWLDTTVTQKTGIGAVVNLNYDYDGLANPVKITNTLDTTDTQALTYDGLDRLKTAGSNSLSYDTVGNISTYTTSSGTLTYGYLNNRLSTVTGSTARSYTYDLYGNVTNDGTKGYIYDDAGNLRSDAYANYDYDGRNLRVHTQKGGADYYHFTTHAGILLGDYAPTGSYQKEYAYLGAKLIALDYRDGSNTPQTAYYHLDALGSPKAATDTAGNLLWKENYHPYGERKLKQANATPNKRWYTGHSEDDTGLLYTGARLYDPAIGRFLGADPVAFTEKNIHSFNRYSYGNNNPYKYVDPDGRDVVLAIKRDTYTSNSVTGVIDVTSNYVKSSFTGYTLETAHAGDNGNKLPIPEGTYDAFIRSDLSPNRIELKDVKDYTYIQVHSAKVPSQLKGCFGVGDERNEDRVENSVRSMKRILDVIDADQRYTFGQGKISVRVEGPNEPPPSIHKRPYLGP